MNESRAMNENITRGHTADSRRNLLADMTCRRVPKFESVRDVIQRICRALFIYFFVYLVWLCCLVEFFGRRPGALTTFVLAGRSAEPPRRKRVTAKTMTLYTIYKVMVFESLLYYTYQVRLGRLDFLSQLQHFQQQRQQQQ